MDIIYLTELDVETIIGIYDWERTTKQTISLDIEMATDIAKAANSDAIEDTLNYKAVAKRLIEYVASTEFQLIETLSEKICDIIMNEFSVPWVKLRVSKPGAIRGSKNVGVMIERGTKI
ncbi:Dihydroneopterin aldolase [hydrothermal vent metagenome]|uniref:dihydroneopterin aldolase n=1 Tax=hydrothermal vent metagenome TaxID=652676 RepID=A0A3B1A6K5_9ZZZZ